MYIENFIDRLSNSGNYIFSAPINLYPADRTIIYSLSDQLSKGNGFTEKQRALAIRLVTKYSNALADALQLNMAAELANPEFLHPIRKLSGAKIVKIKEHINGEKQIFVEFPFNSNIVELFKQYRKSSTVSESAGWDPEERAWVFAFTESNVLFLSTNLPEDFEYDEEFSNVANEIREISLNIEQYVPMISYESGKFIYKNISDKIPQPTSTNLVEVLLDARSYGITCWDESIDLALQSADINPHFKRFIENATCDPTVLIGSTHLSEIEDLLDYSKNILVVIPGGSELEHLRSVHSFLSNKGVTAEQMTVMFRLDSGSGRMCNEFIKENNLNSPVTESTKFVFVSGKIPKPLIESQKKFDLVIHFGTNSAHYTLKNYIRQHHNVISMNLDNKNKELLIG